MWMAGSRNFREMKPDICVIDSSKAFEIDMLYDGRRGDKSEMPSQNIHNDEKTHP